MTSETRDRRVLLKPLALVGILALLAAATVSAGSSASCVSAAQSQSCTPPPVGLVSWWPGDGNATDIADGNDGILQGGATFAPGMVGQAFSLDGIDNFVDAGNAPNLHVSAGDFTVDAWVLFNALSGDMSIVDKMSTGGSNVDGWRLIKQSDNRFWFCLGGTPNGCVPGGPITVQSATVATTGVWFHVVGVKSSSALSIYVNGVLEDTKPLAPFTDTNSADLRIGSYVDHSHLNGLVDEVEIYNRALSAPEIQAILDAGSAGKCKDLVPATPTPTATATATPTPTPTVTPTTTPSPPPSVGGISLDPEQGALPLEATSASRPGAGTALGLAASIAVAVVVTLCGAAWYTRRRQRS